MEAAPTTNADQITVDGALEGNVPVDAANERKQDLFSREACQRRGAACLDCANTGCMFAMQAQQGLNKPSKENVADFSAEKGPKKDYRPDLQDPNKPFVVAAFKKMPDSVTTEKSSQTPQESTTSGTADRTGAAPTETAKAADQTSATPAHQTGSADGESGYTAVAPTTRATRSANYTAEKRQDTPPVQKTPKATVPTKPLVEPTQPKDLSVQEPAAKDSLQIAESAPAPIAASGRQASEAQKPARLEKEAPNTEPKPLEPKNTSAGTSKLRNVASHEDSVSGIDTDSIPETQKAKQADTPRPTKNDQPQTVREATVAAAITAPSVSEGDSAAIKSKDEAKPSHPIDKVSAPTRLSVDTESATADITTEPSDHKESGVGPEDFAIPSEVIAVEVKAAEVPPLPVLSKAHDELTSFEPIVPKTESIVEAPMSATEDIADETLEVAATEEPDATGLLAVHEATEQLAALEDMHEVPSITTEEENAPIEETEESDDTMIHFLNPEPIAITPEPGIATEEANELILDKELPIAESLADPTTDELEPTCPYAFAEDEEYELGLEEATGSLEILHGPFTTYLESQSSDDTDEEAEEPTADLLQSFDHREEQPASNNGNSRKASELARKILGRNAFALAG